MRARYDTCMTAQPATPQHRHTLRVRLPAGTRAQGIIEQRNGQIAPFRPFRPNSLLVMSDVHRGASISAMPDHEVALTRQMGSFEHVVMNGDNFEMFFIDRAFYGFHYNIYDLPNAEMRQLGSARFWHNFAFRDNADAHTVVEHAIDQSVAFLETFLQNNPQTTLHFVLGNHELIRKFRNKLDKLQAHYPNFEWSAEAIKIGDGLFVHGDLPMSRSTDRFRLNFGITDEERVTHRLREARSEMGWVATMTKAVERPGQAVVNFFRSPKRCVPMLHHWLMHHQHLYQTDDSELSISENRVHTPFTMDGIQHVFFGHTHVKFDNLAPQKYGGLVFHNTGALTKTVMKKGGHGMLEADIVDGMLAHVRPFALENTIGYVARR